MVSASTCWVCSGDQLTHYRSGRRGPPSPADFRITDANYGVTLDLVRCARCSFIQAKSAGSVLTQYEQMDDAQYEETRDTRRSQARKLLAAIARDPQHASLLDVGAGSGILVEEALRLGWRAEGVEPSAWLARRASERGLPVAHGTLPHAAIRGPFDVVTLVDVIEHVDAPDAVLRECVHLLKPGGRLFVVTPDVDSVLARVLGRKWWHFRIAHIGYFNRRTLDSLAATVGLRPRSWFRPAWYFEIAYLKERLERYLPLLKRIRVPRRVERLVVGLNLRDSLAVTYSKPI